MTDIGTVLGGRYRLVELLGQGGMATIYRARDNQLERDVAVKVLRPEYGADPDFIDRFRHEAQSAASLNHPNVVAVYDYGTDPAGPFIVMELVEGEDLSTIVRNSGPLPPRAAARLVAQATRAIAAAHDRGFVHRDIKPGNILVTRDGRAKVADFGIARALAESALTLPGTTLGSVHYFSPEQARGELATPASDIYSLGIVLYELLTGKRPWTGDTAAAIATARLTGSVPSPSAVRSGIPPILEAIDRKALATLPEDRFDRAADLADALEAFLGEADRARGAASGTAAGVGAAAGAAAAGAGAGAAAGAAPGGAGAGAAGAAIAGAAAGAALAGAAASDPPLTAAAGVARPNPDARITYPSDAYAGGPPVSSASRSGGSAPSTGSAPPGSRPPAAAATAGDDEPDDRSGPWLWISALLAIAILGLAAILALQLSGKPGESTAPQVAVPNLVGKTFEEAKLAATVLGLKVEQAGFEESTQAVGTVTKQDPAAGASLASGGTIQLTMAIGPLQTTVPDLRARPEGEAVGLIQDAQLRVGTRTEAFDAIIPAGAIVTQDPGPGQLVARQTTVNYVVSKGPEPTPTPAPTPPPTPTPRPTEPPVTAPPTPAPITVGEYRCTILALSESQIDADGFTVGSVSGPNAPDSIVIAQNPAPGLKRAAGSPIDLTVVTAPAETCPT